ncbi:MAG: hypothetical protein R3B98_07630 [Hyphomonas sp.]
MFLLVGPVIAPACSRRNCGNCLAGQSGHTGAMRRVFAFAALMSVALSTGAEPVTPGAARQALADAGADAVDLAFNDGSPVVSGEIDEIPFATQLSGCTGAQLSCTRVQIVSCLPLVGRSRIEALEFTNDWNSGSRVTVAFAREDWLGQSACLKYVDDLEGASRFGPDEIFLWRIDLEDFRQAMEDGTGSPVVADLLDKDAP